MKAGTYEAAKSMKMEDKFGSIQPGLRADLVVLNGNPFEDITAVKRVVMVIKSGDIVKDERNVDT
jgi:imidazolonepropionase-like amidohydrolase